MYFLIIGEDYDGKVYSVFFADPADTMVPTGTKQDDNADIPNPVPSTDTVRNENPYDEIPLFRPIECNGYVDEELTVRVARATDDRDGDVKVEYRIYSPSEKEIGVSADRFTPHEEGTYRIVFTARDAAGNEATETDEIVVRKRGGAPVLVIEEYEPTTAEGEIYTIPEYSAHDAEGELPVRVSVNAPDGSDVVVGAGDAFFVDYAGEYRIRFAAENGEGVSSYQSIFIRSEPTERTREGVDGEFGEDFYRSAAVTSVGGLRGLERIGVSVARASDGIFFALHPRERGRAYRTVSGRERDGSATVRNLLPHRSFSRRQFYLSARDGARIVGRDGAFRTRLFCAPRCRGKIGRGDDDGGGKRGRRRIHGGDLRSLSAARHLRGRVLLFYDGMYPRGG